MRTAERLHYDLKDWAICVSIVAPSSKIKNLTMGKTKKSTKSHFSRVL